MATEERPDLDALLAFWQPRMRLADWDVRVEYKRHMERSGYIIADFAYKRADITIMDPIDWPGGRPLDPERRLVHELGHLHFAAFKTDDDTPLGDAEEQAVEAFSKALVELKRMGMISKKGEPCC